MSIGSVPPGYPSRCIRNITFKDITAEFPIKVIYVKTGDSSNTSSLLSASIENIMYENITAGFSLLSPVYIGPQQQKEPDGTGQGFFAVPTEPRVSIRNITMKSIHIVNNMMNAGLLNCNSSNPCLEIHFKDVLIENVPFEGDGGPSINVDFVCDEPDNMYGTFDNISYPDPSVCVEQVE